jgi:hypothetical protein
MRPRHAQLVLVGVLLAFFSPVLFGGRVVLGHDLGREIGAFDRPGERRLIDRLSDDQTSTYLPELALQLTGARSGWLATWNPDVELGRPAGHLSGLSRVFLPTLLLSFVSHDALRVYTALVVLAAVLAALFGHGFLRALELHPAASLAGALGLALGVFTMHRMNAPMFPWGLCWTLAILWATVRLCGRVTWLSAAALAFAVHALLLTGYPQQVVWHAWFLVPFAAVRVWRRPGGSAARLRAGAALAAAALAGLVLALPVLADVLEATRRSGRAGLDPEFFLAGMRTFGSPADVARFVIDYFDPFWFGDPSRQGFPLPFYGLCTGALGTLAGLSVLGGVLRRSGPWLALVMVAMALSVWPAGYRFAVLHLGLGLSRFGTPGGVVVPAIVCASLGADGVLRGAVRRRGLASALVLAPPAAALALLPWIEPAPDPALLAIGLALCAGVVAFVWTRSAWLLAALAVVATVHYGFRLLPLRRDADVPRSSPLVEAVRAGTPGGARFAWVGNGLRGVLPPNLEAFLGLRSIHAYDPLAWEGYREWVLGLSGRGMEATPPGGGRRQVARSADEYGRHFRRIEDDTRLEAGGLAAAGVSLLLSGDAIDLALATRSGDVAGIGLWTARAEPVLEALLPRWRATQGGVALEAPIAAGPTLGVTRSEDRGDRLRFRLAPAAEQTLLFVSQQFHPRWRARGQGADGAEELATCTVDGFYQGVLVPPGTREVVLEFRPLARHAWLAHVLFLAAFAAALAGRVARRLVRRGAA